MLERWNQHINLDTIRDINHILKFLNFNSALEIHICRQAAKAYTSYSEKTNSQAQQKYLVAINISALIKGAQTWLSTSQKQNNVFPLIGHVVFLQKKKKKQKL